MLLTETAKEPMTLLEIVAATGASENAVRTAIDAIGARDEAKRDRADRRRVVYPVGTLEKVNRWLDTH